MKQIFRTIIFAALFFLPIFAQVNAEGQVWGYFTFKDIETNNHLQQDMHIHLYDMKGKLLTEKSVPAKDAYIVSNEDLYNFQYDKEYIMEIDIMNFKKVQQVVKFTKGSHAQEITLYAEPTFGTLKIFMPPFNSTDDAKVEIYNEQKELVRALNLSNQVSSSARATVDLPPNTYTMKLIGQGDSYGESYRVTEKEVTILPGVTKSVNVHLDKDYSEISIGADYELEDEAGFSTRERLLPDGKYHIKTYDLWTDELIDTYTFETSALPNPYHNLSYEYDKSASITLSFIGYDELKHTSVKLMDSTGAVIDEKQGKPNVKFSNLQVGTYKIQAVVDGVQTFTYEVKISHISEQITATQYVYAPTVNISFKALNEINLQKIISTAEVAIKSNGKKMRAVLNEKNEFIIYNVPVGVHQFTVEVPGYKKVEKELVVSFGETLNIAQLLIEDHPYYAAHKQWPSIPTVDAQKVWTVSFAELLNESTVTNKTVFITDGNGIIQPNVKLSVAKDGKKIIVTNESGYGPGRKYMLHVTNGVQSRSGKKLKNTQMVFYVK